MEGENQAIKRVRERMAKPNFVKKSRKSFRDTFTGEELPAGSSFWWWGTHISKTEPTPEQLAQKSSRRKMTLDDAFSNVLDALLEMKSADEQIDGLSNFISALVEFKREMEEKPASISEQHVEASAATADSGERKELLRTAQSGKRNHHRKVEA